MKYGRFEELPVWQEAIRLGQEIYLLTRDSFFTQPGDLRSQLRRAALSVSNNIAKGYERGTTAELLSFLYIARGSAGEVRSMLHFIVGFEEATGLKADVMRVRTLAESCSRQIQGWANSMQNSDIKGQRHLTDAVRQEHKQHLEREEFEQYLRDINEKSRLERKAKEKKQRQAMQHGISQ